MNVCADVLAGRKTVGTIKGVVVFAGHKPSRSFLRRYTGYVEQFGEQSLLATYTDQEYTAAMRFLVIGCMLAHAPGHALQASHCSLASNVCNLPACCKICIDHSLRSLHCQHGLRGTKSLLGTVMSGIHGLAQTHCWTT